MTKTSKDKIELVRLNIYSLKIWKLIWVNIKFAWKLVGTTIFWERMKYSIICWKMSNSLKKVSQDFSKILLEIAKIQLSRFLLKEYGGFVKEKLICSIFKKMIWKLTFLLSHLQVESNNKKFNSISRTPSHFMPAILSIKTKRMWQSLCLNAWFQLKNGNYYLHQ